MSLQSERIESSSTSQWEDELTDTLIQMVRSLRADEEGEDAVLRLRLTSEISGESLEYSARVKWPRPTLPRTEGGDKP